MSEFIHIDEARFASVNARKEELDLLESYVIENYMYVDALAVKRHIVARRAAIVALATRQSDSEVHTTERNLYGKTLSAWHAFLTGENLAVPSSRYGTTASECAWWAVAGLCAFTGELGEPHEVDVLVDELMSYAVNDNDSLEYLIRRNRTIIPREVIQRLKINGEAI